MIFVLNQVTSARA